MRWVIAAVCVGLAAMVVVHQLRPPPPASTPVVVAARDLPAGTVLTETDLQVEYVSQPLPGPSEPEEVLAGRLVVALPAGAPVVETMLLGPALVEAAPPGTVVVPVRLADAAIVSLARPGDLLDLYLSPADTGGQSLAAERVAEGALILSTMESEDQDSSLFGSPPVSSSSSDVVVVLAVRASDATLLTGASSLAAFRAVLVNDTASR